MTAAPCWAPDTSFATYELTVNSGSGSGAYAVGAVVEITADAAPEGQEFDAWTGDTAGVADVNSAATTLTMPAEAVTVTATYRALPIVDLYEYALDNVDPSAGLEDGLLVYSHLLRNDDPSLAYQLQTRSRLLLGEWVDAGLAPAETNLTETVFDEVLYRIPMDDPVRFFRLRIYQSID